MIWENSSPIWLILKFKEKGLQNLEKSSFEIYSLWKWFLFKIFLINITIGFVIFSKYVIVKLTPQEDSRPESVISEKVKVAVEGQGQDDRNEVTLGPSELSLVGSFCLKDNIQLGKQYSQGFLFRINTWNS